MASSNVRVHSWTPASAADVRSGLLGFVAAQYGNLILDCLAVRRTADGRIVLSYPARTDRGGRRHAIVRPLDDAAREELEREVLRQIGEREDFAA